MTERSGDWFFSDWDEDVEIVDQRRTDEGVVTALRIGDEQAILPAISPDHMHAISALLAQAGETQDATTGIDKNQADS